MLEAWAQATIVISMEVSEEPVLGLGSSFIGLAAKLVHHKASAWHQLPLRQPQWPCLVWPCPMAPVTALQLSAVTQVSTVYLMQDSNDWKRKPT